MYLNLNQSIAVEAGKERFWSNTGTDERQDRIIENRDQLEILLVRSHVETKLAWDLGANDDQMALILQDD